jgi:hypothetical protein
VRGVLHRLWKAWDWVRRAAAAQSSTVLVILPIALVALALAGYAWWWQFLADGVRQNATALQIEQSSLGRQLVWEAFTIEGFPYRVETTIAAPRFTAPDRGTEWSGERVVVHVQPLALNRAVISLEGLQHFFHGSEGRWIQTDGRADKALVTIASVGDAKHIGVEIARLTGKVTIDSRDFNLIVEAADAALSMNEASAREPLPRVELAMRLKNVAVQGPIDLPLGSTINLFEVDAGLKLPTDVPEPSAITLFAAWRNSDTQVDLRRFELDWGGVQVSASGRFKLDVRSLPEGRFLLKLGNHPRILELLRRYGWITAETHAVAKPVLDVLAFASGDPQRRITVPLKIERGEVYLGPARVATLVPPVEAEMPLGPEVGAP